MADCYAVKRAAWDEARRFPERPTLPTDQAWIGAALVLDRSAGLPDLRPIRDRLQGLWRGPLTDAADAPDVVIAVFAEPVAAVGVLPATTLPLTATAGGGLASYIEIAGTPSSTPPVQPAGVMRVRIWWNGRQHAIALERLSVLPVADLWDLPGLTLHEPAAPPAPVARTTDLGESRGAAAEKGLIKIGKPKPVGVDLRDALEDVEAGVRALDERTRLRSILGQLFGKRRSGAAGGAGEAVGGKASGGDGASDAPRKEPGVLENLAGWVRWHTPLGAGLRGQLGDRMKLVEKLMSSGDLDSALKLALALGGRDSAKRHAYPQGLPGQRSSLDFNFQGGGASAPIFSTDVYQSLQTRYLNLARQLEQQGDYRRAAYVYAQLLGNAGQAVQALETGGLFAEGAKLAIQSNQSPVVAIRLLYKAGQTDDALALARRTGCFEQLADESRNKEPRFHAYVVMTWSDLLVATDQPLRALQVTDALVASAEAPADLTEKRASWLGAALEAEAGSGGFGIELAARGVLTGPWLASAATDLEAFPYGPAPTGGAFAGLIAWLQTVLRNDSDAAAQLQLELLHALIRLARPKSAEQVVFWEGPSLRFVEAFARSLLECASSRLGVSEIEALRDLLQRARLPVMAADISKLSKIHQTPVAPQRRWRAPAADTVRPPIQFACLLGSGEMLVWRDSRLLQLLDRHGGVSWQQPVSDVVGLVALGTGTNAIVIQAQADGSSLLTRFASLRRSFHPIGKVALRAHHDIATETDWLVQIAGDIGALDIVKLCAEAPEVEFVWSSSLTERLQTVVFGHSRHGASWITRDISPARHGVLELWTRRANAMETRLCQPRLVAPGQPDFATNWFWHVDTWHGQIWPTSGTGELMPTTPWVVDLEKKAVADAADRFDLLVGFDTFQACDLGRPYISASPAEVEGSAVQSAQTRIVEAGTRKLAFTVEHDPDSDLRCVARGVWSPSDLSGHRPVLLAANDGRLFVIDLTSATVLSI